MLVSKSLGLASSQSEARSAGPIHHARRTLQPGRGDQVAVGGRRRAHAAPEVRHVGRMFDPERLARERLPDAVDAEIVDHGQDRRDLDAERLQSDETSLRGSAKSAGHRNGPDR